MDIKSKHKRFRVLFLRTAIAAAVASTFSSGVVRAQEEKKEEATKLETIEVTGSRIKRVDVEGPAPVAVITRDQIEKLGYTNVTDILGNLSYNSGGTFGPSQSFSFARGAEAVDLRGFGAGRTLILLDGRRLPVFPQGLGGTDQFVDLSSIPSSIIERVEILLDGASAIYGSDAISGVVNIITRKGVEGTTLSARVSGTQDGGGQAQRYQFVRGFSSAESHVQVIGEYTKQSVLRFVDRDFSSSDFNFGGRGSSFGSSFFTDSGNVIADPNCGTPNDSLGGLGVPTTSFCRFDRSKFRQWIPPTEKGSVYVQGDRKIGDIESFIRLGYSSKKVRYQLEPNPFSGGESAAFTSNRIYPDSAFPVDPTTGVNSPGYVPDGAPNDPDPTDGEGGYFFRRLVEFGPRGSDQETEALTGLLGIRGSLGSYTWEAAVSRNTLRFTSLVPTVISSVFDNEVSNNGLNLFQPIPESVVTLASHTQAETAHSRNTLIDATFAGPLGFSLPGGLAQFAAHLDFEDQNYEDRFDAITTAGDVFDGGTGGGGERKYTGFGVETNLPILESVEVRLAGRFDSYNDDSDVGSAFSPMAAISYRPLSSLLLRASAGKSFRAPDLQRLFGATTAGFVSVIDTPRCLAAGGTPGDPSFVDCLEIQSVPSVVGSNRALEEEKGTNFNAGISWEVINNLNLTVDYYRIELEDIVSDLSAQEILDNCARFGQFCDQIQRAPDGTLGSPLTGGSSQALIIATAQNLATQKVEGVDFRLAYEVATAVAGKLRTELNWSHLISVETKNLDSDPLVQQLGQAQIPRNRANWTTDWDLGMWGATLRGDMIGRYPGDLPGLTVEKNEYVSTYITWNLQGRIDLGALGKIRIGVNNLFDKQFPLDPTYRPGTPNVMNQFVTSGTLFYHNALGREGYLSYEINF